MDFSSLYSSASIVAYIPVVSIPDQHYKFFVCDVGGLDEYLIGWKDSKKSYDYYNLIFDAPYEGLKRMGTVVNGYDGEEKEGAVNEENRPIFSIVKHWPRFREKRPTYV